jgi:hypothetical protein
MIERAAVKKKNKKLVVMKCTAKGGFLVRLCCNVPAFVRATTEGGY